MIPPSHRKTDALQPLSTPPVHYLIITTDKTLKYPYNIQSSKFPRILRLILQGNHTERINQRLTHISHTPLVTLKHHPAYLRMKLILVLTHDILIHIATFEVAD